MLTRAEALDKAAFHLEESEKAFGDANIGKHLSLTQLYLTYAHEVSFTPKEEGNG